MSNNNGFTLIEVLIAMVVLALGLLGLAGLQATSLKQNQSANFRSQATLLAYDLADKMRANLSQSAAYIAALPNGTANANCIPNPPSTTGCTAAQMAANDVAVWQTSVKTLLPSGVGSMALNNNGTATIVDDIFTITINWDDNRSGAGDTQFQVSFHL